ncbi:hypothetical protein AIOL_002741 [Candidatus Rhodobacter oscarellae]|uniref:Uncharacterized protein n=1 Tax=Candidatus Rhodobacter oscarellae TaxID=1675527 RepID=A0A0J9GW36_9RHOB|nr:hypothetical protein [Candidatus Rhodobacter lobularis]KMW57773.1 hypothetical protein AIOL_002741 [Candidatus Rhodobacter lobularis]
MAHYAQYFKRVVGDVESGAFFELPQSEGAGFATPEFHTTSARHGTPARIKAGDTIWLFAQLSSDWGKLPVSLDAKIVVRDVEDLVATDPASKAAWKYHADKERSRWFSLFDAKRSIPKLRVTRKNRSTQSILGDPPKHLGQRIRFLQEIADPDPLYALEAEITGQRESFISYRLQDGMEPAFHHAARLMHQGQVVWWDRWRLPRRLVERRNNVSSDALSAAIFGMIKDERPLVWGIETAGYKDPKSYGAAERRAAEALGLYRPVPV